MDTCQNGWELQCINVNGISLGFLEMPQKWNWLHYLAVAFTVCNVIVSNLVPILN